jgi:hypothetical protein
MIAPNSRMFFIFYAVHHRRWRTRHPGWLPTDIRFFVASRFLIEPGRADATVLVIWRADFA